MAYKDPEEKKRKDAEYRARPENKLRLKLYCQQYNKDHKEKRRKQKYAWQKKNRASLTEKHKVYRQKNAERLKQGDRKTHLLRKFGITVKQYNVMLREQGGCCAICHLPEKGRELAVDHNHKTGEIRGLLCAKCNQAVGLLCESVEFLANAISYIEKERSNRARTIPIIRAG